jgi:hypothetical protein
MSSCRHPICELIGDGACGIASGRSRGCTPGIAAKTLLRMRPSMSLGE